MDRSSGRVERAVSEAIRAAPRDARWRGVESLARETARAIDVAAANEEVYAVAQLSPRLLSVLQDLQLTPASCLTTADPLGDFLAELTADSVPALRDAD